jgi:hypothetical protein
VLASTPSTVLLQRYPAWHGVYNGPACAPPGMVQGHPGAAMAAPSAPHASALLPALDGAPCTALLLLAHSNSSSAHPNIPMCMLVMQRLWSWQTCAHDQQRATYGEQARMCSCSASQIDHNFSGNDCSYLGK